MVSTLDFESSDPSSNLGGTSKFLFTFNRHLGLPNRLSFPQAIYFSRGDASHATLQSNNHATLQLTIKQPCNTTITQPCNATITQPCNATLQRNLATQQSRNFATQQSRNLTTQQSQNIATQQSRNLATDFSVLFTQPTVSLSPKQSILAERWIT
jgi:hypothetical protein